MQLTSVFENGAPIDSKYTGEGKDVSPPLSWFDVPNGVMSFALICDDPDAPNPQRPAKEPWVHWVVFNIASDVTALPEGIPRFGREPNRFRRQTPAEAAGSDRRVLHLNWYQSPLGWPTIHGATGSKGTLENRTRPPSPQIVGFLPARK